MAIVKPSTPPNDAEHARPSSRYSLPLYDPHGLGSPSHDTSDQQPYAKQTTSLSPLEIGQSSTSTLTAESSSRSSRRGRRRRSSEFAHTTLDDGSEDDNSNEAKGVSEEINAEPLLWWQRARQGAEAPLSGQSAGKAKEQPALPALITGRTSKPSSSPSPSVRSPAAAFLSSMNESLGSPSSQNGSVMDSERGNSVSPGRSSSQSYRLSMPMFSSLHGSEGSALGLAGAAAQIFDASAQTSESHSASTSTRPDDEGATIGPDGRYLLGKTIGFGGFSTIREAWDLGSVAERKSSGDRETFHRIAVKIVYSDEETTLNDAAREDEELEIWETIPAHPNLLPLLHHEQIVMNTDATGGSKKQAISFLVMPYCEGSLLAYVKSEGSLPDNATASPSNSSLSRTGSLKVSKTPFAQYEATIRQQSAYPRTGSGFVPRSSGARVTSVPLSNFFGQLDLSPSSSAAATGSSSLLRRASSRISRATRPTNGIPFEAARGVMQQVTEALLCLHTRAKIIHGDLKLENVLGQRSVSRSVDPHWKVRHGEIGTDSDDEILPAMRDRLEAPSNESICWRVADFGLARRALSHDGAKTTKTLQHTADMQERALKARKGKTTVGGAGGSLAYTAPEVFLPSTYSSAESERHEADEPSPFAPDMWALGCILYALCSGKLPFADSFEPRLQMKIAKGTWDMPLRLRRRNERKSAVVSSAAVPNTSSRRDRSISGLVASESMSRANSLSSSFVAYEPPHPVHADFGGNALMDMSASMPALQDRTFFMHGGGRSTSDQSIIDHCFADTSFMVEEQEESDLESDDDNQIDREKDGSSRDRVSIRLILKKLLEPDPRKRWTIEQLASHYWISGSSSNVFPGFEDTQKRMLSKADEFAPLQGSLLGHSLSKRPSLAHPSISEHTSQEVLSTGSDADDCTSAVGAEGNDFGRGRTVRRDATSEAVEKSHTCAAQPIDIDRSTSRSRSRSRPRHFRKDSSPWEKMESSFEQALQMAGPWEQIPSRRQLQRSTSADTHGKIRGRSTTTSRERRSVSRPPVLEESKAEDKKDRSPAPPTATSTRGSDGSASRSSTSRSRSRARDTLQEIASRGEVKDSNDDRMWWQRGRKSAW